MTTEASGTAAAAATMTSTSTETQRQASYRPRNESGRMWKVKQKTRSSVANSGKPKKGSPGISFKKQQAERAMRKSNQALQQNLKEQKRIDKEREAERLTEKRKRKAENELKGVKYQEISDPTTLRRMSKKQLRHVKKIQVNKDGVKEIVSPWQ